MGLETLVATKHKLLKAQWWITEIKIDSNEISKMSLDLSPIYVFKLAVLRYWWGYSTKNLILALELPPVPHGVDKKFLSKKIVQILQDSIEALSPKSKFANFLWRFRKKEILIFWDEGIQKEILGIKFF